jgi:hypothetical protein
MVLMVCSSALAPLPGQAAHPAAKSLVAAVPITLREKGDTAPTTRPR